MKISKWIKQLNSHSIYSHEELTKDLAEKTQITAPWDYYLAYDSFTGYDHRAAIVNDDIDPNEKLVSGFEIAEALAEKYASSTKAFKILGQLSGRGSRFDMAVQALEEAKV